MSASLADLSPFLSMGWRDFGQPDVRFHVRFLADLAADLQNIFRNPLDRSVKCVR